MSNIQNETTRIFSILGDSVSTFAGVTPAEAVFYEGWVQIETGVKKLEDTWWMQVICEKKGTLGVNNSYAGSTVSGGLSTSATSQSRLRALGEKGTPDVILVGVGYNDWGYCVPPEEFAAEYVTMLSHLKEMYPLAEIWCATLPEGKMAQAGQTAFFNVDSCISKRIYSEIIREAAKKMGAKIADLSRHGIEYETIDGVHPNKEGMKTIAGLWLKEMG